MVASPDTLLQVATGGKENDVKVWDGNKPTAPTFQAKNVSKMLCSGTSVQWTVTVWGKLLESSKGQNVLPEIVV